MGFRVVLIENEVEMKVKLDNLIVNKGEGDIWIPIDDISIIVIDNLMTNITTRTLCILAEHNVCVVLCNQKHLPIGLYSAYDIHSRVAKTIGYQIEKTKDYYDHIWNEIISIKIKNQASVLKKLQKDENVIRKIEEFAQHIELGDCTNREAHAAKVYFNELMDETYSRGNEELLINSGLDFGYAIIRSYLARLCVAYGLNGQIGIHHKSEYNRFNLVDDLIEPIRPIVDIYAYELLVEEQFFMPEHRKRLINILNHKIIFNNKKMFLCNMMEEYVASYAALLAGSRGSMEFPVLDKYIGEEDEV